MKKYFLILAAVSIVPHLSLAQGANFDAEVDQELDQMYTNKQANQQAANPIQAQPAARAAVQGSAGAGSQPIYILNQATPTSTATAQATQVQKQPVAVIESTPLVESKADQLRKSRQDAEVQTEQKIVEKLEQSRLDDEKRRAQNLFGDKMGPVQNATTQVQAENAYVNTTTQQQAVAAPQPVAVQAVAPAPAAPMAVQTVTPTPAATPQDVREIVREEMKNSMKTDEAKDDEEKKSDRYFSVLGGIGDYPDVSNVRGNYMVGAAIGTKFDDVILEGSFMLSNYTLQQVTGNVNPYYPNLIDTNQYQAAVAAKYELMSGMFRPVVGGVAAYSYRRYDWSQVATNNPYQATTSDSNAFDLGVSAGVDLDLNRKFSLGFEYRYMFNIMSNTGNNAVLTGPQYGATPLEKLSYYTLGLSAKMNF